MKPAKATTRLVVGGTPILNLLPPGEVENRVRKALRMKWLGAFISTLVLVGLVSVASLYWMTQANDERLATQQVAAQLQSKLAGYSDVANTQSTLKALSALRAQAGSNDFDWEPIIAEIEAALPSGVTLTGFTIAPGAAPKAEADASTQVGLSGSLTFSAKTTAAQAETVRSLRGVKTFIKVDAAALSAEGVGKSASYTFAVSFSASQARYTSRFAQVVSK